MTSTAGTQNTLWKLWAALVVVLLAVWATLLLTRPAAVPTSMTPLSGLMTLKSLSAEAMPYEEAIASSNPTFIEFYADWCSTCQSTAPTIEKLHQQYGDKINFVMLNIDDPRWAAQIAEFEASSVPKFALLNAAAQPVDTWVGKVPKAIFAQTFDQALTTIASVE